MTSWIVEYGATTDKRHCATRLPLPFSISFSPTFPDEPNLAWVIAICCTAWKSRPEVEGRGAGMPGPRKAFVGLIAPFFLALGRLRSSLAVECVIIELLMPVLVAAVGAMNRVISWKTYAVGRRPRPFIYNTK
jgi:hypothetical protein